mmetsp:Transcript_21291/g.32543  ORF Transcript_21291/g.32543 Transcript_21291/m.32543 type:complete len:242 (+) Transcript_21291:195-920(+)
MPPQLQRLLLVNRKLIRRNPKRLKSKQDFLRTISKMNPRSMSTRFIRKDGRPGNVTLHIRIVVTKVPHRDLDGRTVNGMIVQKFHLLYVKNGTVRSQIVFDDDDAVTRCGNFVGHGGDLFYVPNGAAHILQIILFRKPRRHEHDDPPRRIPTRQDLTTSRLDPFHGTRRQIRKQHRSTQHVTGTKQRSFRRKVLYDLIGRQGWIVFGTSQKGQLQRFSSNVFRFQVQGEFVGGFAIVDDLA